MGLCDLSPAATYKKHEQSDSLLSGSLRNSSQALGLFHSAYTLSKRVILNANNC